MTACDEFIISLKRIIVSVESLKEQTQYLNDESLAEANGLVKQFDDMMGEINTAINDMAIKIKQYRALQN